MISTQILNLDALIAQLPKREPDANKGQYGRVLVIGGDVGFSGAARLCGEAALRAGAGLVSIATHPYHAASLNVGCPELMVKPIEAPNDLMPHIERATHIALGPGLGQTAWSEQMFQAAIQAHQPMVVDADGLNGLSQSPFSKNNWVLTPHPGEAARLLQTDVESIQADRHAAILALQQQYGGVIILKGAHTLIFDGETLVECDAGNPGMATAGMGDVLTGVVVGLLPQCDTMMQAACTAVGLHARAGDCAAESGQRGLLATDLYPFIQSLLE